MFCDKHSSGRYHFQHLGSINQNISAQKVLPVYFNVCTTFVRILAWSSQLSKGQCSDLILSYMRLYQTNNAMPCTILASHAPSWLFRWCFCSIFGVEKVNDLLRPWAGDSPFDVIPWITWKRFTPSVSNQWITWKVAKLDVNGWVVSRFTKVVRSNSCCETLSILLDKLETYGRHNPNGPVRGMQTVFKKYFRLGCCIVVDLDES